VLLERALGALQKGKHGVRLLYRPCFFRTAAVPVEVEEQAKRRTLELPDPVPFAGIGADKRLVTGAAGGDPLLLPGRS